MCEPSAIQGMPCGPPGQAQPGRSPGPDRQNREALGPAGCAWIQQIHRPPCAPRNDSSPSCGVPPISYRVLRGESAGLTGGVRSRAGNCACEPRAGCSFCHANQMKAEKEEGFWREQRPEAWLGENKTKRQPGIARVLCRVLCRRAGAAGYVCVPCMCASAGERALQAMCMCVPCAGCL
eukprot:gene10635-biopygen13860